MHELGYMTQKQKIELYEKFLEKLSIYHVSAEIEGIKELAKNADRWNYALKQEQSEETKRLIDWAFRTLCKTPETDRTIRHRLKKKKSRPVLS